MASFCAVALFSSRLHSFPFNCSTQKNPILRCLCSQSENNETSNAVELLLLVFELKLKYGGITPSTIKWNTNVRIKFNENKSVNLTQNDELGSLSTKSISST